MTFDQYGHLMPKGLTPMVDEESISGDVATRQDPMSGYVPDAASVRPYSRPDGRVKALRSRCDGVTVSSPRTPMADIAQGHLPRSSSVSSAPTDTGPDAARQVCQWSVHSAGLDRTAPDRRATRSGGVGPNSA